MKTISVNASTQYAVKIGSGLLSTIGFELKSVTKACNVCIVSDSNVASLYLESVETYLKLAGFACVSFVFPAGEESKSGSTYLQLLNFLADHHFTRSDCLVALGGGVIGDLTGFTAATYLRGIDYVQLPTTLLAAVDSSVGGKTAIDLDAGKNLAGAFYQPRLVLCDTDTLDTLPSDILRDGCAEVIKYGILYDEHLFSHLQDKGLNFDREYVISRCVELKRNVVVQDEFDRGERQKLNLGHTFAHGIEANSHFSVSHGKAVAIGMAIAARAATKKNLCSSATRDAILQTLERFGLPIRSDYPARDLYIAALSDKKRSGSTVNIILPEKIGLCQICPTPVGEIQLLIEAGL